MIDVVEIELVVALKTLHEIRDAMYIDLKELGLLPKNTAPKEHCKPMDLWVIARNALNGGEIGKAKGR